jgi:hypothetical protein
MLVTGVAAPRPGVEDAVMDNRFYKSALAAAASRQAAGFRAGLQAASAASVQSHPKT